MSPAFTSVLEKVPTTVFAATFSLTALALKVMSLGAVAGAKGVAETDALAVPAPALFTARI